MTHRSQTHRSQTHRSQTRRSQTQPDAIDNLLPDLIRLRHRLHRQPELSGAEKCTAAMLVDYLSRFEPDGMLEGLGGNGLAVVFDGSEAADDGPTLLLRADLDALPIEESNDFAHRSQRAGVAHKCGHDGHMAILAGVAASLAARRPQRGRAVLLFQPAEETGAGARAVLDDPRFAALAPDCCFALHNVPGYPLGEVLLRNGTMSCASRGLRIRLQGKSAHAAHPEAGRAPTAALAQLLEGLPRQALKVDGLALATVVHARLGEAAFGTAPGEAEVLVTLRADSDSGMQRLVARVESLVRAAAEQSSLGVELSWHDVFRASHNDSGAAAAVREAARASASPLREMAEPFRWSEDFAEFTIAYPGALFGLGAGEASAQLHNPDYDFPDQLIGRGLRLFRALLDQRLAASPGSSSSR